MNETSKINWTEIKENINVQAVVEFLVDRARVNQLVCAVCIEWFQLVFPLPRDEGKGPLIKQRLRPEYCNRTSARARAEYF